MSDFKGRHFRGEIVLWAVRWYCRYPISYRGSVAKSGYLVTCLRDLPRGVEA